MWWVSQACSPLGVPPDGTPKTRQLAKAVSGADGLDRVQRGRSLAFRPPRPISVDRWCLDAPTIGRTPGYGLPTYRFALPPIV